MGEEQKAIDDFTEEDKVTSPEFHSFKENDILVGTLLRYGKGQYGDYPILLVNEQEVSVGGYTALMSKLKEEDFGKRIKIVCTGEKKSQTGRLYLDFDVFIK